MILILGSKRGFVFTIENSSATIDLYTLVVCEKTKEWKIKHLNLLIRWLEDLKDYNFCKTWSVTDTEEVNQPSVADLYRFLMSHICNFSTIYTVNLNFNKLSLNS